MRKQIALVMVASAAYGFSRLAINYAAIHGVGPSFAGQVNSLISLITVILVFAAQPIAATLNRFAPRYRAEGRHEAAGDLLGRCSLITLGVTTFVYGCLLWKAEDIQAAISLDRGAWYFVVAGYVFGYGFYFLFKMAYFGFGRSAAYVRTELASVGAMCLSLVIVVHEGRAFWLALALVCQPVVFSILAVRDLRGVYIWKHLGKKGSAKHEDGLRYAGLWLAASAAGFAAYHGSILVMALAGVNAPTVGYYALCLSLIAPLNVLPSILSQVMFPRLAANAAIGQDRPNLLIIRSVMSLLVVFLTVGVSIVCGCAPWILRTVGVMPSSSWIAVVQILVIGTAVSLLSTPCGNYLFADSYAATAAVIGVCSLGIGACLWVVAIPGLGAVGAALGYAGIMIARGVANMVVVNHYARWQVGFPWKWCVAVGVIACLCGLAYTAFNEVTKSTIVCVGIMGTLLVFSEEVRSAMSGIPVQVGESVGSALDE